ncbi:hypothetical protein BRADI_2g07993v3, partial [Brachypodium distachyon]
SRRSQKRRPEKRWTRQLRTSTIASRAWCKGTAPPSKCPSVASSPAERRACTSTIYSSRLTTSTDMKPQRPYKTAASPFPLITASSAFSYRIQIKTSRSDKENPDRRHSSAMAEHASHMAGEAVGHAQDTTGHVAHQAHDAAGTAHDAAHDGAAHAGGLMEDAVGQAQLVARSAADTVKDAAGAAADAVGAAADAAASATGAN